MVKIIIAVIIAVVLVIFIAQNTLVVNFTFFAWTGSISLAFLMLIILVVGALLGYILAEIAHFRKSISQRNKDKRKEVEEKVMAEKARHKQEDIKEKQEKKQRRR